MRELRIREMPEELYEWLQEEAERRGLSVRAWVISEWWRTKEGQDKDKDGTEEGKGGK